MLGSSLGAQSMWANVWLLSYNPNPVVRNFTPTLTIYISARTLNASTKKLQVTKTSNK
jgi:hypothetical protein